jgi:adenylyl- and sulfurtransferase ThiI
VCPKGKITRNKLEKRLKNNVKNTKTDKKAHKILICKVRILQIPDSKVFFRGFLKLKPNIYNKIIPRR